MLLAQEVAQISGMHMARKTFGFLAKKPSSSVADSYCNAQRTLYTQVCIDVYLRRCTARQVEVFSDGLLAFGR